MANRVVLIGRLTKDPELREVGDDKSNTRFIVAAKRRYTVKEGAQNADFIPVVCWNKLAENVCTYCHKGSLVCVEGSLHSHAYDDENGQRVYSLDVNAESVEFLDTRSEREGE